MSESEKSQHPEGESAAAAGTVGAAMGARDSKTVSGTAGDTPESAASANGKAAATPTGGATDPSVGPDAGSGLGPETASDADLSAALDGIDASLAADLDADQAIAFEEDARDAEIAALIAERDQLKDKLMRALAEAENVRRRAERDRKDAEAYGGTKLARDLLSVHDDLQRALANADETLRENHASFIEGVELTLRELINAFAKHKIEQTAPAKGDKFDPNLHQAMFEAPIPGADPGTVIEVMTVGFTISGRLLRPAMVGVARAAE
ncbi:MAG: nucleotide exchange factor GrpE [Pseudomonadota bacterium]